MAIAPSFSFEDARRLVGSLNNISDEIALIGGRSVSLHAAIRAASNPNNMLGQTILRVGDFRSGDPRRIQAGVDWYRKFLGEAQAAFGGKRSERAQFFRQVIELHDFVVNSTPRL